MEAALQLGSYQRALNLIHTPGVSRCLSQSVLETPEQQNPVTEQHGGAVWEAGG